MIHADNHADRGRRATRRIVFASAAVLLPACVLTGGCAGDGSMDPNVSNMLGAVSGGRLASGSKEMKAVGGAAKLGAAATMSDADVRPIGESIALALVNDVGLVQDQQLAQYVTKVGLTVAAVSPRPELQFTFGVLDTDDVNAYSAPGGYVFVTRGLLAKMQDEAELAAILAHEVGHVCRQHGLKAIQGATAGSAVSDLLSAGTTNSAAAAAMPLVDAGIQGFGKPFSQNDEREADAEAVKYLKAAGYDAGALARIIERMQSGGGALRTHPPTAQRVANIRSLAGNAGGATNKERFAANVKM